jgi:hypothetical protein
MLRAGYHREGNTPTPTGGFQEPLEVVEKEFAMICVSSANNRDIGSITV